MHNDIERYVLSKGKAIGLKEAKATVMENSYSNKVYRIDSGRKRVILKVIIDPLISEKRVAEKEVLLMNLFSDIAPRVLLADSFDGHPAIFMEYLKGPALSDTKITRKDLLRCARLLARIHSVKISPKIRSAIARKYLKVPEENLDGSIEWLKSFGKRDEIVNRAIIVYRKFRRYYSENITAFTPVICHGDFKLNNIIKGGNSLKAIDWEAALVGDPAYDINVLLWVADAEGERLLSKELREDLLDEYLRIRPDATLRKRMTVYYNIANLQALFWIIRAYLAYNSGRVIRESSKEEFRSVIKSNLRRFEKAKLGNKKLMLYLYKND